MKFLVTLIAVTLASQGVLFSPENKIHPIAQVIVGLSELASKDFDFQQLFVALDELADSFKTRREEENQLYETEYQQYLADQSFYTNQITDLEGKIAQLEVEIKDLTSSRDADQAYLLEKKGDLFDATKMFNSKQAQINNDESAFNTKNTEYSDTINVLDEAIKLLSEVKDTQSLIQRQAQIKEAGNRMHKHFHSMKHRRIFFQPLVKSVKAFAEQNYVDQDNLNKVLTYMNNLRQSLIDAQTTLKNEFDSQSAIQKGILAEIQGKITDLKEIQIPDIEKQINIKDGELTGLKSILNDAQRNLQDAKDSLDAVNNRWIERTKSHNELIAQYDNELLVIKDAENALKKGGIFRQ